MPSTSSGSTMFQTFPFTTFTSNNLTQTEHKQLLQATAAPPSEVSELMYLLLLFVIPVIAVTLFLLTFCRKRKSKNGDATGKPGASNIEIGSESAHDTYQSLNMNTTDVLLDGPRLTRGNKVTASEGKDVTVSCWFVFPGRNMSFCKNNCQDKKNILLQSETSKKKWQNLKYILEYRTKVGYIIDVTIQKVTTSDSGSYQCLLERSVLNEQTFSDPTVILKPSVMPSTSSGSTMFQTFPFTTFTSNNLSQTEHKQLLQATTAPPSASKR
ncbi:hypothetical protein WMY93_027776 [Mugilogobius chulae]|uniref:Ig-like domain-containing protein n=1 Tax=Mugilogobius chulae TaxID=88201 RepID=A0AAW0MYI7_9GOBI